MSGVIARRKKCDCLHKSDVLQPLLIFKYPIAIKVLRNAVFFIFEVPNNVFTQMENEILSSGEIEESLTGGGTSSASPSPSKLVARAEITFKIFESSIRRAENLLYVKIDATGNPLSIKEDKLLDVYRAVIVLSISALDAYVKTFLIVEIKQRLSEKNLSPDLKRYIKEELFSKETLHLVVLENNFFDKVVERFEEDFEKKSFQGQKAIERYMKLAGFDQIFRQIADSADKSLNNLLASLESYTKRRHLIVHCGDHDLNQTKLTENQISEKHATECVELVQLIASHIHKLNQSK